MYVNGSFHMISNGGGLVVGVDFANHSSDFSVATVMRKVENGVFEIVESSIIGKGIPDDDYKQKVLDNYEKFCNQETVEQKST
nr:MAG TPA: hypothetical protein [Caudoviricetes sp.]